MGGFINNIFRFRILIIIIAIVIIAVFGYFAKNIKINPDVTAYMPESDPVVKTFNHIGNEFGGNFVAMVIVQADDIFTPSTIKQIDYLTSQFKQLDGVADVISLTNILDIKKSHDGIEVGRLINPDEIPQHPIDLQKLKVYVLTKDMYRGHIIAPDGKTTLIICRLASQASQIKTARRIKEIANQADSHLKIYFAGLPFQILEINDLIRKDLKLLIPLVGFLISILLLFSFRSQLGVMLPLSSVLISIVITLGLMSMLKIPLTIISNIIPVILFTVGSAYGIHILNRYYETSTTEVEPAKTALKAIYLPIVLAALTTIVGFISFVFGSYLTMIRQFGIFTSIGILLAMLNSLILIPILLSFKQSNRRTIKQLPNADTFQLKKSLLGDKFTQWALNRPKIILSSTVLIIIIGILGVPRINRVSDMLNYFHANTQIRRSEAIMKEKFGGSVPIQILIQGDIQDPLVLNQIKNLQDFLASLPGVENPQSIVDLIQEMSYAIGENKVIPDAKAKVHNLWFLIEGEETVRQLVSDDKSEAILQAMVSGTQTRQSKKLLHDIQAYLAKLNSSQATFTLTGSPLIYEHLDRSLIRSQLQSLIIAIGLILLCLAFMQRSFWGGLIGIVPILVTLIVIFGVMGYCQIPLDVATVLVGSISIGIGIDYAIHFLNRYQKELKLRNNKPAALRITLHTSGRAILINVVTVALGFLMLLFANLIPLQRFGILIAITMLTSGLSTLTVLPAIILICQNKQKEKNYENKN